MKYPRHHTVLKSSVETGRMHTSNQAAASPSQGWGLAVLRSSLNLIIFLGIILYVVFIWIWEAPNYEWFYGHFASGDVNIEYKTSDEKGAPQVASARTFAHVMLVNVLRKERSKSWRLIETPLYLLLCLLSCNLICMNAKTRVS